MAQAPGPRGHYLHGHAREFGASPLAFLIEHHRIYGDFFRFRVGMKETFVVSDVAEIQRILTNRQAFTDSSRSHRMEHAYRQSVARIEGHAHVERRRLLQPGFTQAALVARGDAIAQVMGRRAAAWPGEGVGPEEGELRALVLDGLICALLGSEGSARSLELLQAIPVIEAWLGGQPVDQAAIHGAQAKLHQQVLAIADARRAGSPGARAPSDLLDHLLGGIDDQRIDREIMVDELAMMLMTNIPTALALRWAWHYVATLPDVRERAQSQVMAVAGGGPVLMTHIKHLPYVEHVVREALRLHPPVWTLAREALCDWPVGQYSIPRGADVMLSPYVLQRSARYWREPERFAPERFEPDAALYTRRPRLAFMPFGAGHRKCIGERLAMAVMVLATAALLQRVPAAAGG